MKVWGKYKAAKKELERAEAVYEQSKTAENPEGTRPQHKKGLLGLCGAKVDSIDFYVEQVKELTRLVEAERQRTLREEELPAAFVFFNNRRAAAEASQVYYISSWVHNCPFSWIYNYGSDSEFCFLWVGEFSSGCPCAICHAMASVPSS
jgi:hypothetical protein